MNNSTIAQKLNNVPNAEFTYAEFTYIGCFFDHDEAEKLRAHRAGKALDKQIASLHITFEYGPEDMRTRLFGKEVTVRVVGYGNNGKNEGYLVEISSGDEEVKALADKIALPHITLSRALDASSVDTKDLDFAEIEPFSVTGRFGGYSEEIGPVTGIGR